MRPGTTLCAGIGVLIIVVTLACQQLSSNDARVKESAQAPGTSAVSTRGRELFELHCAVCHGSEGRGDGPAAPLLFPPVRDFARGFRLVSTDNGAPSHEDLLATLKRGMPGSSMPSWDWLGARDLSALAKHTRQLAIQGLAEDLQYREATEARLGSADALAQARRIHSPGAPLRFSLENGELERGRVLYEQSCASCHEQDGSGSSVPLWNDSAELNWPRDFTAGFMKGSASSEALAHRILAGMPGSSMPASSFANPTDLASLVTYVHSLIPEGSEYRLVHRRQRVVAKRIAPPLPTDPSHLEWRNAGETLVALAPLWWQEDSVLQASLAALHDGKTLAVRLRWRDATGESSSLSNSRLPDGAAVQFSDDATPPGFGMGSHQDPTTIWHWRSHHPIELAGELDVRVPHGSDATQYQLIQEPTDRNKPASELSGRGVGNASAVNATAEGVSVIANWEQGEWEVIFLCSLEARESDPFSPELGSRVQMACSIWNGDAADTGGHKSISIWHELELER